MSPLTGCTINASTVNSQAKGSHLSVAEPNWKELTRVITGWSVASLGAALFLIWGVFVGGHDRLVVFVVGVVDVCGLLWIWRHFWALCLLLLTIICGMLYGIIMSAEQ
jgi:hypothetical protein